MAAMCLGVKNLRKKADIHMKMINYIKKKNDIYMGKREIFYVYFIVVVIFNVVCVTPK
jgi:hypothetical protein